MGATSAKRSDGSPIARSRLQFRVLGEHARGEVVVTTSWGLGESVVGGTVSPDTYVVRKADLSIVARQTGPKLRMTVTARGGTEEIEVPEHDRNRPAVTDAECIDAVRMAIALEAEMGWPVDLECAWQDGTRYLLQCRPITTLPDARREQ